MSSLTRILILPVVGALAALTAAGNAAHVDAASQHLESVAADDASLVGQNGLSDPQLDECHLLKRAIARHACRARLSSEVDAGGAGGD
jgi:hypothetical protein